MDHNKTKLALGVISGRVDFNNFDNNDWNDLGFEPYNFGAFGRPDYHEVLNKAEDIIVDLLNSKKELQCSNS